MNTPTLRRALVSCYDKTGLAEIGHALVEHGVEIVSTGSTAKTLTDAGLPVTPVEQVTGVPECLDGRVKTLHPAIHAGLLANRSLASHVEQLDQMGIAAFDLVVSNLYPFTQTVASGATVEECIEQIDIGGPSMVRAAAKNHAWVAVITSPDQYPLLADALAAGGFTAQQRCDLAAAAFAHTAAYDTAVATWMGHELATPTEDGWPVFAGAAWTKLTGLRYGENSHQKAALYADSAVPAGLAQAQVLHGKAMSYNNYTDGEAAYRACHDFAQPCVAIIKHANPCGIAIGEDIAQAHLKAHACDPVSAYGGVVAANREVSAKMAAQLRDIFTEVVLAPSFSPEALEILTAKKNVRLLVVPPYSPRVFDVKTISGGVLLQDIDRIDDAGDDPANWRLVAGQPAGDAMLADLVFAWRAVRAVKSNAILLAHDQASVGVGMGQVNRVDSCKLAVERANTLGGGERARGSVASSDAYFPFNDGPQVLFDAGVAAIVQPGGSIRDQDTIDAANAAGVTMYMTGTRHFFH